MSTLTKACKMIRVDLAGELTARYIYQGQLSVLRVFSPSSAPLVEKMSEQEETHLQLFDELIKKYQGRPTLLEPFCVAGGWLLGASSALLGLSAAMACTEAVENVVSEHYTAQLRELVSNGEDGSDEKVQSLDNNIRIQNDADGQWRSLLSSSTPIWNADSKKTLASVIAKCRDDELEHLETAVKYDTHATLTYSIATKIISAGVSASIFLAHRF